MRFMALMTPTIQRTREGQVRPAEADRLAERVREEVEAEAELVHEAGHQELDEELLPGVGAAQVVVEAEERDREAAHEEADDVLALGEKQRADAPVKEHQADRAARRTR